MFPGPNWISNIEKRMKTTVWPMHLGTGMADVSMASTFEWEFTNNTSGDWETSLRECCKNNTHSIACPVVCICVMRQCGIINGRVITRRALETQPFNSVSILNRFQEIISETNIRISTMSFFNNALYILLNSGYLFKIKYAVREQTVANLITHKPWVPNQENGSSFFSNIEQRSDLNVVLSPQSKKCLRPVFTKKSICFVSSSGAMKAVHPVNFIIDIKNFIEQYKKIRDDWVTIDKENIEEFSKEMRKFVKKEKREVMQISFIRGAVFLIVNDGDVGRIFAIGSDRDVLSAFNVNHVLKEFKELFSIKLLNKRGVSYSDWFRSNLKENDSFIDCKVDCSTASKTMRL